jgi:hypothetical protein
MFWEKASENCDFRKFQAKNEGENCVSGKISRLPGSLISAVLPHKVQISSRKSRRELGFLKEKFATRENLVP